MFTEDLPQFIADFGETVTRSNATTFLAIFDAAYIDPLEIASSDPTLTTLASNSLTRNQALTVRGVQYLVRTVEPDATGIVIARLAKL